jgi:fibronectin type 3 domain-containing protein/curli biogenesis system outer membrane secretion channel CsgG
MRKVPVALTILPAIVPILFLYACGGTPNTSGAGYVKPHYQSSGYSKKDLAQVNAFVSPQARTKRYQKVAVMPFRAPVELAGASIADLLTTELLQTYKYQMVERSQMEQVLGEQALGLKGVTDSSLAIEVGKILGVQGVIVGTVPEYGMRAVGPKELPAIGLNIRMIDVVDGTVVWSVSHSGVSSEITSLSSFSETLIRLSVAALKAKWIEAGDTLAVNFPPPEVVSTSGSLREATVEVLSNPVHVGYRLSRARSRDDVYQDVNEVKRSGGTVVLRDKELLDLETYYYRVAGVTDTGLTSMPAGPFEITTAGPPAMVEGFTGVSGIIREVPLSWTPSSEPYLKGYKIFRREGGGKWKETKKLNDPGSASYTDSRRDDGVTYEFRIIAFNEVNVEGPPSTTTATTKGPPSPVADLKAASGLPRQVRLTWEPVREPEVKGYAVLRAARESGPYKEIGTVDGQEASEYSDQGKSGWGSSEPSLKDETRYFYKVRAVNVVDVESDDPPAAAAVTKPVPAEVTGLRTEQYKVRKVSLRWIPNPEPDIARYEVYRGSKAGSVNKKIAEIPAEKNEYVDKGLENGQTYHYRVRAIDQDGLVGRHSPSVDSQTKPTPKKPKGLTGVEEDGIIMLTWQENPERDITHYEIVKRGTWSQEVVGRTEKPPFAYTPEKGGKFKLRVQAVDADGLKSEESDEFIVKLEKK